MSRAENRNKRFASLALVAALACSAGTCEGAGSTGGTRRNELIEGFGLDPFVSIHSQLDQQEARDLFEVIAEEGSYWRVYALDLFDGGTFTSSDPLADERGLEYESSAELEPQIGNDTADDPARSYQFEILAETEAPWLPMPQRTESVTLTNGGFTYDPFLNQAVVDGGLDEGLEYSVKAPVVMPTAQELDAASAEFLTPEQYGVWTSLPDSLDPRIAEIALAWTEDEPNAYRQVLAIQQRFQGGDFTYDTAAEPAAGADALVEFLTETKTGFCSHYSSAMAVMARTLGLPARIAVGYRAGTRQSGGSYLVQSDDAHVWVEVLFPGYGWLPFEPEAGSIHPNARVGTYLNP